jgi:hypothetical protein
MFLGFSHYIVRVVILVLVVAVVDQVFNSFGAGNYDFTLLLIVTAAK